jgi:hypothetical protein
MTDDTELPADDRRREIFAALVAAQDDGVSVARSRAMVASRFGITTATVAIIEREGMDNEWPPL